MAEFSHNSGLDIILLYLLFDSLWNSFNKECVRSFMIQAIPVCHGPVQEKGSVEKCVSAQTVVQTWSSLHSICFLKLNSL